MQQFIKNIPALLFSGILFALILGTSAFKPVVPGNCDVDTARIAAVEFTVYGMDSITINNVQDALDTACGVNFNFACWNDTVVFVEYDSVLTSPDRLMKVIRKVGFTPSVRAMY